MRCSWALVFFFKKEINKFLTPTSSQNPGVWGPPREDMMFIYFNALNCPLVCNTRTYTARISLLTSAPASSQGNG